MPLCPVTDLERSHSELRPALIIGGREIRRLDFGRRGWTYASVSYDPQDAEEMG